MTNTQHGVPLPQGLTLPEKMIEQIHVSSVALEKAAAFQEKVAAAQAAAEKLIPQACDVMIQHERITPAQREKLAEALRSHSKCIELLIKVAGHRNAEELSRLGQRVDGAGQVKTASANGQRGPAPEQSLTSPHVGARTTMIKQSDCSLFRGLGLNVPTGG